MYGSPAGSRDLNLSFPASPFKHGKEESDPNHHQHPQHRQQMMSSGGLQRYRSAPSTLLGEVCEDFIPHRSSSPPEAAAAAAATMFARFMPSDFRDPTGEKPPAAANRVPQFMPPAAATAMEHEASVGVGLQQSGAFSSCATEMLYRSHQQQLPSQSSASAAASLESSYGGVARSMAMGQQQAKSSANCSNLIRHSSSPAGLFVNPENGYGVMRGMGGFRPGSNGDPAVGGSRLKGQISFSSRQGSSTGLMMSQISELGGEGIGGSSPEDNGGGGCHRYISGYPVASWEDPSLLSDSFSALKRGGRDVNPSSEAQNGDVRNHVLGLSHQFSFPKTSSEMAAVEKLLQFQDSVPCKIRAKRGCATHPRSIAERVRRTRISERMRKLQELVPNMEKQTNTADMLDLAVEYIKDLQKQVKGLSDSRANCTCCSNKQKPYSSSPAV